MQHHACAAPAYGLNQGAEATCSTTRRVQFIPGLRVSAKARLKAQPVSAMRSQQGKAFRAEGQRQGRPGKAQPATAPCDLSKAFRAESQRQRHDQAKPSKYSAMRSRQGQDSLNRNASSKERAVETHRLEPRQAVRFVEVLLYQLLQGTLARAASRSRNGSLS
jgi:hypothetical protein